jgi:hypothetical protein
VTSHDNAAAYDTILDALARELAKTEAVAIERDAKPRRPMADVKEEEASLDRQEREISSEERDAFREALEDALTRGGERGEASYASDDPDQDAKADILTKYLVRLGYAEVRTDERGEGRYTYHIKVLWDRIREIAQREGATPPI